MLNDTCRVSKVLAYAMSTYTCASIYYLFATRKIGTPFNDSLTYKQKKIKKRSASIRRNIFYKGIILSMVLLWVVKPLN